MFYRLVLFFYRALGDNGPVDPSTREFIAAAFATVHGTRRALHKKYA